MSQSDLFSTEQNSANEQYKHEMFTLSHGELTYYHDFLNLEHSQVLFSTLKSEVNWQQPNIKIAGRNIPIPRLQAWYGDHDYAYTYSGKTFFADYWHPDILELKAKIEHATGYQFNSALCNLYRDEKDGVAWHADDEPELGEQAVIASYSLGASRPFQFRSKKDHHDTFKLVLKHNDLLIMGPQVQNFWHHQVPKSSKPIAPRINITFRKILSPTGK